MGNQRIAQLIARGLVDKGQPIEDGWKAFTIIAPKSLPRTKEELMGWLHFAYFSGAHHAFSMTDAAFEDEDKADRRVGLIDAELEAWRGSNFPNAP